MEYTIQEETIMNKVYEQANEKCKNLESLKDINEIIKKYFVLEEILITQIKILNNDSLKDKIYNLLYKNFYKENDLKVLKEKSEYEKKVTKGFFDFYLIQDIEKEIKEIFYKEEGKEFGLEKKDILNRIQKTIFFEALNYTKNYINSDIIPNFLFYPVNNLLMFKIEEILINKFHFKVEKDPFLLSEHFEYLKTKYKELIEGKIEIFDKSIFDEEERILFFKILVLCNWKYINNSENNKKIFYNNLKKYITLLGLKEKINEIIGEFQTIIEINDEEEIKSGIQLINDEILLKLNNREKFLFFIFSFSIMLNSLSLINKKNENKMSFLPKIKCSSKERQFLIHLLLNFNATEINYYLENDVYQNTLKFYTKILYDEKLEKKKIIYFDEILKLITDLAKKKNDENLTLNDLEVNVISNFLGKFIQKKNEIFDFRYALNLPIKIPLNLFSKTKTIHSFINYDISKLNLNPLNLSKTSTQIYLIIEGVFSNKLLNINSLSYFLYKNKNANCDFYMYKWQTNINSSDYFYNKKVAKFYGKLLAYIIISRTIFKFQCINLIGFSFGCHVIKHCLIELNKIYSKIDNDDILNDVIFIGGATDLNMDKYPNILNNIGGRIINIFSENDELLKEYNEDSLGLKVLFNNSLYKTSHSIININLSLKIVNQYDYLNEITRIINEEIKLY